MKWTTRRLTQEEREGFAKAGIKVGPTVHEGHDPSDEEIAEDVREFWRSGKWILYVLAFIGVMALCSILL